MSAEIKCKISENSYRYSASCVYLLRYREHNAENNTQTTHTMKIDLTWTSDSLFTTFLVNSEAGREAYKQIIDVCGAPKVLNQHRDSTIYQLKQAGYGVRKSTAKVSKVKDFTDSDLALLDSLGC